MRNKSVQAARLSHPSRWAFAFGVLSVLAVWLLARPYVGIRHDGLLYMGQALLSAGARGLNHDLFFAYGSQDRFSLFSPLVAELYRAVGVGDAQLLLMAACHGALLGVLWMGLKAHLPAIPLWLGLLTFAGASHFYGGLRVFSVAEPFVTARTLAEPLLVAGLLLVTPSSAAVDPRPDRLRWRWASAVGLLAFAATVHPLMALPAWAVAVAWCFRERVQHWTALAAVIVVVFALSAWGFLPDSRLTDRFDGEWLASVHKSNAHVFIQHWRLNDLLQIALDVCVLYSVQRQAGVVLQRLLRSLLLATCALLALSAVAADLYGSILVTQLQLWRVLWLTHLFALLLLPSLVLSIWRSGGYGHALATAIALGAFAVDVEWSASWAFMLWVALVAGVRNRPALLSGDRSRELLAASLVALLGLLVAVVFQMHAELTAKGLYNDTGAWLWALARLPIASILLVLLGFACLSEWRKALPSGRSGLLVALRPALACMVALFLLAGALLHWDRRDSWSRELETMAPIELVLDEPLPLDAQILWLDEMLANWTLLQRPSYFSFMQGAGLLFNRGTAIEFSRRLQILQPVYFQREVCQMISNITGHSGGGDACQPDLELIQDVCRARGGPDFVVLTTSYGRRPTASWVIEKDGGQRVYLHDCKKLAAPAAEPVAARTGRARP